MLAFNFSEFKGRFIGVVLVPNIELCLVKVSCVGKKSSLVSSFTNLLALSCETKHLVQEIYFFFL